MQAPMQTPMRAIPVATAALLTLALSGCPNDQVRGESVPSDPDGVACEDSAGAAAVWIDVEYSGAAVGTSSEECEVDQGTEITWRGPAASRDEFQVIFDTASPAGSASASASAMRSMSSPGTSPLEFTSTYSDGRQKIQITANNASGTYVYVISRGGVIVDPAIIIR